MKRLAIMALVLVFGLGVAAMADTTVTNGWNMASGLLFIVSTTNVGPSNFPGLVDPVVTNLTIDGQSNGTLVSNTTINAGNPYYGTFILDSETLTAMGFKAGQISSPAMEFQFDANDDVYGLDPSNGLLANAKAVGNYSVLIKTKNDTFDVESALDATMNIPQGGGVAAVYVLQGSVKQNEANLLLGTSGTGELWVVKPTAYCQYLANTLLADMNATGTGGFVITALTTNTVGFDYSSKGTIDVNQNQVVDADDILGTLTQNGSFITSLNFKDTMPVNLVFGAGTGAYWPSLPQHINTGIVIDFDAQNLEDVGP